MFDGTLHSLLLCMQIAKTLRPLVLGVILCASHSRTFSLINGYSAPLEIYKHLEHHDDVGEGTQFCLKIAIKHHIPIFSGITILIHMKYFS